MIEEQGRPKRLRLNLPVTVTFLDEDSRSGDVSQGRLHDLSVGGCSFTHERAILVGNRVHVRILLNEELAAKWNRTELNANGVVVRTVPEESAYLISVRFLPAKPKEIHE